MFQIFIYLIEAKNETICGMFCFIFILSKQILTIEISKIINNIGSCSFIIKGHTPFHNSQKFKFIVGINANFQNRLNQTTCTHKFQCQFVWRSLQCVLQRSFHFKIQMLTKKTHSIDEDCFLLCSKCVCKTIIYLNMDSNQSLKRWRLRFLVYS